MTQTVYHLKELFSSREWFEIDHPSPDFDPLLFLNSCLDSSRRQLEQSPKTRGTTSKAARAKVRLEAEIARLVRTIETKSFVVSDTPKGIKVELGP